MVKNHDLLKEKGSEMAFWPHFSLIAALLATGLRLMAKNRDLLEEKGSEMAREGVFACVARIVWPAAPRIMTK